VWGCTILSPVSGHNDGAVKVREKAGRVSASEAVTISPRSLIGSSVYSRLIRVVSVVGSRGSWLVRMVRSCLYGWFARFVDVVRRRFVVEVRGVRSCRFVGVVVDAVGWQFVALESFS
jgi:hypothetical protein